MRIKILNSLLANQIAAGEVIERPQSVVKELVENSLDAGSSDITIHIEQGGIKRIKVTDNGYGIHHEDLALALSRHGTSKIDSVYDLQAISSLGFRGEALASIAAVSRVTLISCEKDAKNAWQIQANADHNAPKLTPAAHPIGTTVDIHDLFFNIPARRNFLRAVRTEAYHVEEVVKRLALSYRDVKFSLLQDKREIFTLPKATDIKTEEQRIKKIFGKRFIDNAIRMDFTIGSLRLWGYLSLPEYHLSVTTQQYFYVNQRMVRDKVISHALRQSYQNLLPEGRHAAFILFFQCPAEEVDVNVHPTKHEVRFREQRLVHDFIVRALKEVALTDAGKSMQAVVSNDVGQSKQAHVLKDAEDSMEVIKPVIATEHYPTNAYSGKQSQHYFYDAIERTANTTMVEVRTPKIVERTVTGVLGHALAVTRHDYVITETENGVWCIHFKNIVSLWYKIILGNDGKIIPAQPLLIPQSIHLSKIEIEKILALQSELKLLGIEFTEAGDETILVRKLPELLKGLPYRELFKKLAQAANASQISNVSRMDLIETIAAFAGEHSKPSMISLQRINDMLRDCENGLPKDTVWAQVLKAEFVVV